MRMRRGFLPILLLNVIFLSGCTTYDSYWDKHAECTNIRHELYLLQKNPTQLRTIITPPQTAMQMRSVVVNKHTSDLTRQYQQLGCQSFLESLHNAWRGD